MTDSAMDTAARLGEIPFTAFTTELINGVFDALLEAHIVQMEEYNEFVQTLTQDLSSYINNTQDGVEFEDITDFVLKYDLPTLSDESISALLDKMQSPTESNNSAVSGSDVEQDTWYGALIDALGPSVEALVDKIHDPDNTPALQAIKDYNDGQPDVPTFSQIHDAIANLISSNKYSLLQNMAQQGLMRLVVSDGEVETKMTFSTWQESETKVNKRDRQRAKIKQKTKMRKGILGVFNKARRKERVRQVTVNTAKTYHRDTSGTKVDVFGRVLVRFKSDYSPLNNG